MSSAGTYVANLLRQTTLFSDVQIGELVDTARAGEKSVTATVVDSGYAREDAFLQAMAKVLNLTYLRVGIDAIPPEVLERLPTKAVFQYNVVPLAFENDTLTVACNDPLNMPLLDALRLAAGTRVRLSLSPGDDIIAAAKALYGVGAETVDRMMQDNRFEVEPEEGLGKVELSELDQEASIV
ncbi:MAG: hypothetical protein O3B24_04590, partial [Verrucomicrobia bacterium]|nr:hypothetical protein [Verrucomicrobiota bacterium]